MRFLSASPAFVFVCLFTMVAHGKPPELALAGVYEKGVDLTDYYVSEKWMASARIGTASFGWAGAGLRNSLAQPGVMSRSTIADAISVCLPGNEYRQ